MLTVPDQLNTASAFYHCVACCRHRGLLGAILAAMHASDLCNHDSLRCKLSASSSSSRALTDGAGA